MPVRGEIARGIVRNVGPRRKPCTPPTPCGVTRPALKRKTGHGYAALLIAFCVVISAQAVSLKVVRPESGERLSLPIGYTFVIGTVTPADSSVTCNGEECDVDEDGAFYGFVPIRTVSDGVERNGKVLDSPFEFVAKHEDDETKVTVHAMSPKSPSARWKPDEIFKEAKTIRVRHWEWIGLEEPRLGEVVLVPEGAILKAHAATSGAYRCRTLLGTEISIPKGNAEEVEASEGDVDAPAAWEISTSGGRKLRISRDKDTKWTLPFTGEPWGLRLFRDGGRECVEPKSRGDVVHGLKGLRVCLDPGHHADPGAIGPRGFEERASTLLISREVARQLTEAGAEVSFTREEDPMPLKERHERMRAVKPDLVVSIHNNSAGEGQDVRKRHGTQTFYLFPWSKALAESVHRAICDRMGTDDLGCIQRNLYIPRYPECPTILVEPEYIILPGQEKKFMERGYRRKLASAIVDGIHDFVEKKGEGK